jgi:hypothetical protein
VIDLIHAHSAWAVAAQTTRNSAACPKPVAVASSLALLDCRLLHADVLVRSHVQIIMTSRCTRTCAGLPPSVAYRRPMMTRDLEISSVSRSTRGRFIDKTRSAGSFAGRLDSCSLGRLLFRRILV